MRFEGIDDAPSIRKKVKAANIGEVIELTLQAYNSGLMWYYDSLLANEKLKEIKRGKEERDFGTVYVIELEIVGKVSI